MGSRGWPGGPGGSAACPAAAGCLLLALLLLLMPPAAEPAKRLDCRAFCRLTGFRFNAGLCKCGYMLFASKRSQPPLSAAYLSGQDPSEGGYRSFGPAERFQLEVAAPSPLLRHSAGVGAPTVFDGHSAAQGSDSVDPPHAAAARTAAAALLGHKPDAGPDAEDTFLPLTHAAETPIYDGNHRCRGHLLRGELSVLLCPETNERRTWIEKDHHGHWENPLLVSQYAATLLSACSYTLSQGGILTPSVICEIKLSLQSLA